MNDDGQSVTAMKQFQVDLSEKELQELERLTTFAGLRTKRELVTNAMTLFRWAAMELLQGRSLGSMDAKGAFKQMEMPSLSAFAELGRDWPLSTLDELRAKAQQPSRTLQEILHECAK